MGAVPLTLLLLLWVLYRPAFSAPFYLDTWVHLQDRTNLHVTELSWSSLDQAIRLDYGGALYRPLSYLSLALTHYFWGLEPAAYRAGNLIIHWAAALALWFLFVTIFHSPRMQTGAGPPRPSRHIAAFLAVALWALHPVQTNVATYVIQRMAGLAGLFTFLTVALYLRSRLQPPGRRRRWWGLACGLSFLLGMASKESGAVIVPLCALAEIVWIGDRSANGSRRGAKIWGAAACAALLAVALWTGPGLLRWLEGGYRVFGFTVWERLLTEARIQLSYLLVLFVPDPRLLTLDAQVAVSRSVVHPPATLAALIGLALAVWLALGSRRTHPLLSFGILWFLVAQAAEATVLPLELYFEHRMYVPSAFFFLGLALLFDRLMRSRTLLRPCAAAVLVTTLAGYSSATYARNLIWADPVSLWSDAVAKAPGKARPRLNLAMALIDIGAFVPAEEALHRARALGIDEGLYRYNLADLYTRTGREEAAGAELEQIAVQGGELAWKAHGWLALKALKHGDIQRAGVHLERALELKPTDPELWNLASRYHLRAGRLDAAEAAARKALRYDRANPRALRSLAEVEESRGPRDLDPDASIREAPPAPAD